jgi:hypothetical protein
MTTEPFELYRLEEDLTREQVIEGLSRVPADLRRVLAGCAHEVLSRRRGAEEWSAIEVCRHLRDVVQVYGMRFKWMILDDDPLLPNYDEDRWVAQHPDGVTELDAMLTEISAYRAETVRLLRSLPPQSWERTGRHEVLGRVQLDAYVRHELAHERGHLRQLAHAIGTHDS